ncbi:MAG: alpha/beta fold hydrolase [Desulfatibacillaceae bacterium]|nr:alpha/beta fold hydrolase [Desulfatibacillaceae bacterium]
MQAQTVTFEADGLTLAGDLFMPPNSKPNLVVGCHGLFADRLSPKQQALGNNLPQKGLAYFCFDHRGCGDSQGDFEKDTSLNARMRDLAAAIKALRQTNLFGPGLGLFGSSFGGSTVLLYALKNPVDALVLYAAPVDGNILGNTMRSLPEGKKLPQAFFEEMAALSLPKEGISPGPLLIIHGNKDAVVPVSQAMELYEIAFEPKKLIIFEEGDHPMSNPGHQRIFLNRAGAWLAEFLDKK